MGKACAVGIKVFENNGFLMRISPNLYSELGFAQVLRSCLSYGTQKCFVNIELSQDAGDNEIYLSRKAADYLHIPDFPDFEAALMGEELVFGPHIGIIAFNHDMYINYSYLKRALDFIPEYSLLHGSVIVFAVDKINQAKRLVEGYCYNPKSKLWFRGVFPYPRAIFLMLLLDTDMKNHLLSAIGNTVFNNFFINKYEMHKILSRNPEFVPLLPETILYNSKEDIFNMLDKHGTVYVKSISGQCGKEVIRISRNGEGKIYIGYRESYKNVDNYPEDYIEAGRLIEKLLTAGIFVIQQGINLMTYQGKAFDFRHMVQKDGSGRWASKGIIGRIAAPGSVVSNISNGGKAMWAKELLKKSQNLSDDDANALVDKMTSLGLSICEELDRSGTLYGDLGIDIGIDSDKKLWIIEINSRGPDPAIAFFVNDRKLYKDLVSTPLLYAKHLAGFKSSN